MWRLYPLLKWFWGSILVGGVGVTLLTGCLTDLVQGKVCSQWEVLRLLYFPLLALGLVSLVVLWDHRRHQREQELDRRTQKARESFELLKPANELSPVDLDFQVMEKRGEPLLQGRRPFYATYIRRTTVPYDRQAGEQNPQQFYEEDLVKELQDGKGFVLVGAPLDGKSRTLYEIVRRMYGYEVLKPNPKKELPEDFSLLVKEDQRVVLLLDDVTKYVGSKIDLTELGARLGRHASSWVVASTCRDGPELRTVEKNLGTFYEDIRFKLGLVAATAEDKGQLAESIDEHLDPKESENYPTLGSITMEEPMEAMKLRFKNLLHEDSEQAYILRGLKLLAAGGILPLTQDRLQAVLEHIFGTPTFHLDHRLELLAQQSFLRSGSQDPIQPEHAYLRYVVTYIAGKYIEDDFAKLANVLKGLEDYEGLFDLGITYTLIYEQFEEAIASFDAALRIRSDYFEALHNKGVALDYLGRYKEAIACYDAALGIRSDDAKALYNKGNALGNLGRYKEAIAYYDAALGIRSDDAEVLYNKGVALHSLKHYKEAIASYDAALGIRSDYAEALYNKIVALLKQERKDEALEHLYRAWRTREGLSDKGALLAELFAYLGKEPEECQ
jgi:tetratricopeptide (TPR) repeat protein